MTPDWLSIGASVAGTVASASLVAIGAAAVKIARAVERMELQIGGDDKKHTVMGRLATLESWKERTEIRISGLDRRRLEEPDGRD
jgi:hypothetical protein